jgi:3-hydroxyisobutyrate dehydrogenase-like beta-hydroxyacid dehydrogenase
MRVSVFGLGEAGSLIAADLVQVGVEVHGFDPADVSTPDGVQRHSLPTSAAAGAELVLAVTAAADAREAMAQAWEVIGPETVYADLATSSPKLKEEMGDVAAERGVPFADVALMAPVPGNGLSTPALASGPAASLVAAALNPLGARLDPIGDVPGVAQARKLTRSVVTKGLAGLVREAMAAARAAGDEQWARDHIVALLESTDRELIERLLAGTDVHAERRLAEMEAAADYLNDLGVPADLTAGTIEHLRRAT